MAFGIDFLSANMVEAIVIALFTIFFAKISGKILSIIEQKGAAKTTSRLDDIMIASIRTPIALGILFSGLYLALTRIPFEATFFETITVGFSVIMSFYGAYVLTRIVKGFLQWYAIDIAANTDSKKDDQFIPIIRKVATIAIFVFTSITVLNNLGIEVTALLAAMGVGGIAVALALQGTFSNFFAGTTIFADRTIKLGDFIELEGGIQGEVVDIGWRSTKLKTPPNNLVIVPNTKLAESVITDYNIPTEDMSTVIKCGVSYESNLDEVEKATMEIARKMQKQSPFSAKNPDPVFPIFRYTEFGDSNINFIVVLRAKDRGSSFQITHDFIKTLKRRFDKEGIEIAYPTRTIYMEKKK